MPPQGESLQAQLDKNAGQPMNNNELLMIKKDLENPDNLKALKEKMRSDPEFKKESIAFLKSFEKSPDYYNAVNVNDKGAMNATEKAKNATVINDYNNLMFTLLGADVFKFEKENIVEGLEQKRNDFIQMNVGTININNPTTIANIDTQLGPILTGIKNGTYEITSPDITVVGLTSDLPNVDDNGNDLNPGLRRDRANVAVSVLQNFATKYGVNLPLIKSTTGFQAPGSYDPKVDLNTNVPKFTKRHGVNFEFSYRTVQSSPNLPKINVDVQLDSKTIEGKHVQIFKDLIDDYLLTQSPSPEVTDQLIALKEAIPNDSSINTTNLNTFHQFLTNPIQSKYGLTGKPLASLNGSAEGKQVLELLNKQLQEKNQEGGGGGQGFDGAGIGGRTSTTYFGSLNGMEYDPQTKKYTSRDKKEVKSDYETSAHGSMPINSPNATSSLAEKEANLSTTSSLNLFFNHADLKSMGVPISAVAGEKSVDLSGIPLEQLLTKYQEKQIDLLNKDSGWKIIFDMAKFTTVPFDPKISPKISSDYYNTQLQQIENLHLTDLTKKSIINMHLNNIMLAEVNKQKIDWARRNGYLI